MKPIARLGRLPRRLAVATVSLYRRHEGSYLLFAFLLPLSLMAVIYAIIGVFPFGRGSVLVLDLNGQYVYFFEALRDCVWGDSSLLYSFSRALGGEFLGMYAYYLASPLSYLVALFPRDGILDALCLMLLLKQGLSGLSFGYYLRRTTALSPTSTVLFSTVYSLTAYGVVMQHNTMWTDNVILLPLIALGIRALVTERRYKLYTFSLVLALMSNFYIGYMTCIFSVLYFFYVHAALDRTVKNPQGDRLFFVRSGARFALFSLIAGAISALIVIPAAYSLTFGKSTFTDPTYEFASKIDLFDIFTKFFFGSYDTVRPEGLPLVYCGIATLLLIPLYFISKRYSLREKASGAALCLVLLFSFSIQVIDMVWHGGQAPNWLNYRYSYMLTFLLIEMAAKAYHGIRDHSARHVVYAAIPLFLFLTLTEHFDYAGLDGALVNEVGTKHMESIFFPIGANLLCLGIYVIALSLVIVRRDVLFRVATRALLLVVSVEMLLAGLLNLVQLHLDVVISSRDSYLGYKERWEEAFLTAKEGEDSEFFRMEKLNYRKVNDPFMLDYRGLSGSTSTLNRDTIRFLDAMGYQSRSHLSCYNGVTPFTDAFLSIKYVAGEATDVFPDRYEKIYDNGDVVTYKNPDALPIAFGVSSAVNGITFFDYERDKDGNRTDPDDDRTVHNEESPFERMNALASALLGEEVTLFVPLACRTSYNNVTYSRPGRYAAISNLKTASVSFTVEGVDGREIYAYFPAYFPTASAAKSVGYALNGIDRGTLFNGEESGYLPLGSYAEGERCTVTFTLADKPFYCTAPYFCTLDDAVYRRLIDTLSAGGYEVERCTEDTFTGRITVSEDFPTVLTTIPYDKGWRVTVDGEEITPYETLDALLAFDLPAGEHTLTLRYRPREYNLALILSLSGGAALSLILFTDHLLKRKKQRAAKAAGKDPEVCTTTSEEI